MDSFLYSYQYSCYYKDSFLYSYQYSCYYKDSFLYSYQYSCSTRIVSCTITNIHVQVCVMWREMKLISQMCPLAHTNVQGIVLRHTSRNKSLKFTGPLHLKREWIKRGEGRVRKFSLIWVSISDLNNELNIAGITSPIIPDWRKTINTSPIKTY